VWKWLKRLGIRLKRGRDYIHSPDPDYIAKERRILEALSEAAINYGRVVLLYEDEMGYHRQPTVSTDYHAMGQRQPLARRSTQTNTLRRIAATLDAISGWVLQRQAAHISVKVFKEFLKDLRGAYSQAEKLYLVLDNWKTVHHHPGVYQQAEQLGITLLFLPTYAPWLNPIEKLWRWLYQEVLHLHQRADEWQRLQEEVTGFLDRFAEAGGPACRQLLHYVGLTPRISS
jgi:hypothetical protein